MKNKPFVKLGMFGFLTASAILSCYNQTTVEANDNGISPTHIGTYNGSTTFTTSSANGVNPALFIEVIDKDGNSVQYESEDGVITVENTRAGAYVKQAKLLGKTMYRDLDTGELLESWEEGRNLELQSSEAPSLKVATHKELIGGAFFESVSDNNKIATLDVANDYTNFTMSSATRWAGINFNYFADSIDAHFKEVVVEFESKLLEGDGANSTIGYEWATIKEGNNTIPTNGKYKAILSCNSNRDNNRIGGVGLYPSTVWASSPVTYEIKNLRVYKNDGRDFETSVIRTSDDLTLRGVAGVQDELNLINGKITKRIGEKKLDGSETWTTKWNEWNEHTHFFNGGHNDVYNFTTIMSDVFNSTSGNPEYSKVSMSIGHSSDWGGYPLIVTFPNTLIDDMNNKVDSFKRWLSQNPTKIQFKLAEESSYNVNLITDDYFSPETTAQVSIEGETVPLVASITVPTETLSFMIDPNQEADKQFIAPEFSVTNDTYAPLRLEIKSFTQLTNEMNDVLPSKYSDWDVLNKTESNDIALAVVPQKGDGWKTLTEGERYVADNSNYELGVIKPTETVNFNFSALHGRTILKPLNLKYELSFIFDFE